jgi:hypothetical protein
MLERSSYPFCYEFSIVEKSIEVAVIINEEEKCIRIEALHNPNHSTMPYIARAYIRKSIIVQPEYPKENGNPEPVSVWVNYNHLLSSGGVQGNSADEVIAQALSFLRDICRPA